MYLREEVGYVETADGQQLALTEIRPRERRGAANRVAFLLLHGFAQNRRTYSLGPMPRSLIARGASVILSNSDTPRIRELYEGLSPRPKIDEVTVPRSINSKGTGRGRIGELLIYA